MIAPRCAPTTVRLSVVGAALAAIARRNGWDDRAQVRSYGGRGNEARTLVPMPIVLSIEMRPPWASTMALARGAGSSLLKMPDPTNTARVWANLSLNRLWIIQPLT